MPEFEWPLIGNNLYHLGIAFVLALPVAFDRSQSTRSAGLRTFPLVAVAACGYTLVGISVLDTTDAEARVMQGVITGMALSAAAQSSKPRTWCAAPRPRRACGIPA